MKKSERKKLKKAILQNLEKGVGVWQVCSTVGISYSTLWSWREADEKFNEQVESIAMSRAQLVEDQVFKDALKGNTHAQSLFLKAHWPKKYGDKPASVINLDVRKYNITKIDLRELKDKPINELVDIFRENALSERS